MAIAKLVAGAGPNDAAASDGADIAESVNALIDLSADTVYTLGVIGDSRLANGYISPVPGAGAKSAGFQVQMVVSWIRALSGQRVDMPPQFSLAVSGTTTTQILSQAQAMAALSAKPDFCLINGGTNDFAASATAAAAALAFSNITYAAQKIQSAGIIPIIEIDVPRTTSSWTAAASTISASFNRMLRIWCSENDVLLCDYEGQYVVPSTGEPASGFNVSDGIHPSAVGSSVRALQYLQCLDKFLSKHNWQMKSARDLYDATLNKKGNMLANPLFSGTGGSNTGTGASGTVPTSWQNRVISGTMTAVASKLAAATSSDVGERLQIVASFTTAGEHRLQPSGVGGGAPAPAGVSVGDLLYAEVDVEITALSGSIKSLQLSLFDYDGAANISYVFDFKQSLWPGNPLPVVPLPAPNGVGNLYSSLKLRLKTPPMIYGDGATPTQLNWRLTTDGEAGAAITYNCSVPQLRVM